MFKLISLEVQKSVFFFISEGNSKFEKLENKEGQDFSEQSHF